MEFTDIFDKVHIDIVCIHADIRIGFILYD